MFYEAIIFSSVTILIVLLYRETPPTPPSEVAAFNVKKERSKSMGIDLKDDDNEIKNKKMSAGKSISTLMTNWNYLPIFLFVANNLGIYGLFSGALE